MCAAVVEPDRARFSRDLEALNMKPLWERRVRLQPGTPAVPALWRWEKVRPELMRSTELISARERFDFAPHDVFVAPSWEFCELKAGSDCVLFSYSDRAAQEALGFWREQRE